MSRITDFKNIEEKLRKIEHNEPPHEIMRKPLITDAISEEQRLELEAEIKQKFEPV